MLKRFYTIIVILSLFTLCFVTSQALSQHRQKPGYYDIKSTLYALSPEDSSKSMVKLAGEIDALIAKSKIQSSQFSIAIYSLDRNRYIYSRNKDLALTPASTTKLFTSYTALYLMGPNYPVKTQIYANGSKTQDGVINGDLYIKGKGDGLFSSSELDSLVILLTQLDIRKINGRVIADGYFFDGNINRYNYSGDADEVQPVAPISALSIDRNKVTVFVTGSKSNQAPSIRTMPESEAFTLSNSAKTAFSKKKRRPSIKISTKTINGKQSFFISGTIAPGATYSYTFFTGNPPLAVAGALKAKLNRQGIEVTGDIAESKLPPSSKLIAEFSRPLLSFLFDINKNSDNYVAECIYKLIGAHSGNNTNTAAEASRVISSITGQYSIVAPQYKINDGSGLSRRNKVTADCLINLLKSAYNMPWYEEYLSTFSIAGFDGTLRRRMLNTRAEQRLRGKTGTHRNVSALAGYAVTMDGENIAYAFIFNGNQVGSYKNMEDELCKTISRFFYYNEDF